MSEQITTRGRDIDRIDPRTGGLPEGFGNASYATHRLSVRQQTEFTLFIFAKAAVIGFLLSILVLLVAPILADVRLIPILVFVGTILSLLYLLESPQNVFSSVIILPIICLGAGVFVLSSQWLSIWWAVMCIALLIAHQSMLHFAYWRSASPIGQELADELRSDASGRIRSLTFWIHFLSVPAFGIFVTPRLTQLLEQTPVSLWAHPLTVLLFALFLFLLPFAFGVLRGQSASAGDMLAGTWKAIRSYVNYGRMESEIATDRYERSVGILHSPGGLVRHRVLFFHVAVVLIATTLLPMCDYFPTGEVPSEPFNWSQFFQVKPNLQPPPTEETNARPVSAYPGNWIFHAVAKSKENTASLLNLSASMFFMLIAPGAFLFLFCFALAGNYNGQVHAATKDAFAAHEGSNPTPGAKANGQVDTKARWNSLIKRFQHEDPDHILVGRNVYTDAQLPVHISHFKEHVHYLGGTGSGKTALGLSPLISQLIRMGDCNVVIFDLKYDRHDRSFFENARIEAENAGHDFKFFTTRPDLPTHLCNPFLEPEGVTDDADTRAEQLCEALGLLYGEAYGESYFSDVAVRIGRRVFDSLTDESGRLRQSINFHVLLEAIKEVHARAPKSERKLVEDSSQLLSALEKCTYVPTINYDPIRTDPDLVRGSIAFEDLYDDTRPPQVYFFGITGQTEPKRCGVLTRLFTNRLLKTGQSVGRRPRQTYVIIDEFQLAAAPSFTIILDQARAAKVGLILANQSMAAIRKCGGDALEAAFFDNVAYRQIFRVQEPNELKRFETLAGKYIKEKVTVTETRDSEGELKSVSRSVSLGEESRFDVTDFRAMSANPQQSIAFPTKNAGQTQTGGMPVLIESDYHISKEDMDKRAIAAPPPASPERISALDFAKSVEAQQKDVPSSTSPPVPKRFHHGSDDAED